MVHIVLVEPEIPQNCGNIARTCAATGRRLHLIRPLGFDISDRAVKRAGLDYWHLVEVFDYENLEDFFLRRPEAAEDLWLATTKAPQDYCQARFREGCWLFFGKETAGLPEAFRLAHYDRCIPKRWPICGWPPPRLRRITRRPDSRRTAGCFSARRRRGCRRTSARPTMTAASACPWSPRPGV